MSRDITVAEVLRARSKCEADIRATLQEFAALLREAGVQIADVRVDVQPCQQIGADMVPEVRVVMELAP